MNNYIIQNHNENLDIFSLSHTFKIEHKILRSFLNSNNLTCKLKENTSHKKSFFPPEEALLFSPLSIIAHSIYLCEGWHTNKTDCLSFCNQDLQLIKIFCQCLISIYQYNTKIAVTLVYNPHDKNSIELIEDISKEFTSNIYLLYCNHDTTRKNPIIRVKIGGKNLSYLFIENAYKIIHGKSLL